MNSLSPQVTRLHQDPYLIIILAALTALGPLSTDAYLPALPAVAAGLDRTIHDVELSISLFLVGLAAGQLIGGPLSDHAGRRAGILSGLGLFLLATGLITLTDSIEGLWGWRALQGIGAGIAAVNVPAIIRDLYSGREGAQALSRAAMIMMLTPILSPTLGLLVTQVFNWRAIFILLAIYGALLLAVIAHRLPETRRVSVTRIGAFKRYGWVLRTPRAWVHLLSVGCVYGSLFAYVTASPWLYIEYFGVDETLYPLIFAVNVVSLILMNRLNIQFLKRYEPSRLLMVAKLGQWAFALVLFGYVFWVQALTVPGVVLLVMATLCWHGVLVANSMASITELFPDNSGTATALMGGFGFLLGSVSSALVGLLANGTALPMASIMLVCATLGLVISLLGAWTGSETPRT